MIGAYSVRVKTMRLILITLMALWNLALCSAQLPTAPNPPTSPSDLGEAQLKLVLQDRPQLQPIVQKGSKIWDWLAAAFSNTSQGIQIYWDNRSTSSLFPASAESTLPDDQKAAYIRVDAVYKTGSSVGLQRSPEEILSSLVFELNNVSHWAENRDTTLLAESGKISREDYIRACAKPEYLAGHETADFYLKIWVPLSNEKHLSCTPRLWYAPNHIDFDEWLSHYSRSSWYPWQYYGDRYDWITAQREADSKLGQGDLNGAIADYSKAIKLGPRSYGSRGVAEMAKGDWEPALADFQQCNVLTLGGSNSIDHNQNFIWLICVQKGQKNRSRSSAKELLPNTSNFYQ